jgi:hypothetical protein
MQAATKALCCALAGSMTLPASLTASAAMITTAEARAATIASTARANVASIVSRADVARELQAMGIDPQTARARIAAMTDEEARTLAGRVDALPAGGVSGAFGWVVAAAVAITLYIMYR